MSIKIHWGPNGSYKSSGAIQDDLIPAWQQGRTIITNVRGISHQRLIDAGFVQNEDAEDGEFIVIDGDTRAGKEQLSKFFHWAPAGAFLFVDEASTVWPKRWRDTDMAQLNYPAGPDQADADDRPRDFYHAFEQHRHWNWDLVLTTPNIRKIRDEIRECADGGYKHKNQKLIGIGGRYLEGFHDPMIDKPTVRDFNSVNDRKIKKNVFNCYDSTKTGVFSDSISGRPFWRNTRFLLVASVAIAAFAFLLSRPIPSVLTGGSKPVAASSSPASPVPVAPGPVVAGQGVVQAPSAGVPLVSGPVVRPADALVDPFVGRQVFIAGAVTMKGRTRYVFRVVAEDLIDVMLTSDQLLEMGVDVLPRGDCYASLIFPGGARPVVCGAPSRQNQPVIAARPAVLPRDPEPSAATINAPARPSLSAIPRKS